MIKILHTEWSGGWGGQEIRILSEMAGLKSRGYWVGLAAASHTPIYQKAREMGFPVFALGFRGNLDVKTLWGLMRIIRAEKINLVNTHSGKDTWVGGLAAKFCGAKFIRTRHLSYQTKKSSWIHKLADHIVTTGEAARQGMIQNKLVMPDNITTVPTRPDGEIFNPALFNKSKIKLSLGLDEEVILIGILAFLRRMKRIDIFLELASQIKNNFKYKNKKIKFLIIGDGPLREEVLKWIQEKDLEQEVVFLGYQEHPEKYMAVLDIGVLTSDVGEATPQSLTQYLMMGLPVLMTEICCIPDMPNISSCQIVPINNLTAMLNKIDLFLSDLDFYQAEAKKFRAYALEHYSATVMLDQMEAVIQKVLRD